MAIRTLIIGYAIISLSQAAPMAANTTGIEAPTHSAAVYSSAAIVTTPPSISAPALNSSVLTSAKSNDTALPDPYDELWSILVPPTSSSNLLPECSPDLTRFGPPPPDFCPVHQRPKPGGDCDMYCVRDILERVAKSAAAVGIEDAITAFDALEWINTNYTSFNSSSNSTREVNLPFEEDMLNVILNIANNILSNYMVEADNCDDGCLARSLEVIAYRSSLGAIRWCHYLFTKAGLQAVDWQQLGTMMRVYMVLSDRDHLWLPIENGEDEPSPDDTKKPYCMTTKVWEWKPTMSAAPPATANVPPPTYAVTIAPRPNILVDGTIVGEVPPTYTPAPALLEAVIPAEFRPSGLLDDLLYADPCKPVASQTPTAPSGDGGAPLFEWSRDKSLDYIKKEHPRLHRLLWDLYNTPPTSWTERYTRLNHQVGNVVSVVDKFYPMEFAQIELFPEYFESSLTNSREHYLERNGTPNVIEERAPPPEGDVSVRRQYDNATDRMISLHRRTEVGESSAMAQQRMLPPDPYAAIPDTEFDAVRDLRAYNQWYNGIHGTGYRDLYHHIEYDAVDESSDPLRKYDPPSVNEFERWEEPSGRGARQTAKQKWLRLRTDEVKLRSRLGAGIEDPEVWREKRAKLLNVEKQLKNFDRNVLSKYGTVDPAAAYADEALEIRFRFRGYTDAEWESQKWAFDDEWQKIYQEYPEMKDDIRRVEKRITRKPWVKLLDMTYTNEEGLTRLGLVPYNPTLTAGNALRPGEYVDERGRVFPVGEGPEWAKGGKRWRAAKTAAKWASVTQDEGGLVARIFRWFLRVFRI